MRLPAHLIIITGSITSTVWGWCPIGRRAGSKCKEKYLHVRVDLGGGLLEVFSSHTRYTFGQLPGMDTSIVVHEIVGSGLGEVVLGFVVHDLVVDPPLGTLQLLIADLGCVV